MGLLDDVDHVLQDIEEAKQQFDDILPQSGWNADLVELGVSVGKVFGFRILRSTETGFPHLELTFTDRGVYTFNGKKVLGGTNATYSGFLDRSLVFYGQGNGMSVALTKPERCYSTWLTEGTANLQPTLTGAGIYRGSILYRWDGAFAELNGVPAIFQLQINDLGITFGKIWRWNTATQAA